MDTPNPTIEQAVKQYIDSKMLSRAKGTAEAYRYALIRYCDALSLNGISPTHLATDIDEKSVTWFLQEMKDLTVATEKMYLAALVGFFSFLEAENIQTVNMPKVKQLIKLYSRREPERLYNYDAEGIENLVECAMKLAGVPVENDKERLINLRDRALIVTLADTGLRIHEACKLRRGDLNIKTRQAIVIGKGDREAVVRFSPRAIDAIHDYLAARTPLMDGKSGKPLSSLFIFSRHDRGAGNKVKGMTTTTGRDIIARRVKECLDKQPDMKITPHTMRHRFVTEILRSSNNLKLAQSLARHRNIKITERYAHLTDSELDEGYRKAIEQ